MISTICKKRVEAEEQFANSLSYIIPDEYDNHNPVMQALVENLLLEITIHKDFTQKIRTLCLPQSTAFASKIAAQKKQLQKTVNSNLNNLNNKVANVQKHKGWIRDAEAKLEDLPFSKRDSQREYVQKLKNAAEKPKQELLDCTRETMINFTNSINKQYREFEKERRIQERQFALLASLIKADTKAEMERKDRESAELLANLDIEDKTEQYVNRLLNPKLDNVNFDDELQVYAYCIADFESTESGDLRMQVGDKIRVIKQNKNGWNEGELKGKKGLYPSNFTIIPKVSEEVTAHVNAVFVASDPNEPRTPNGIQVLTGDMVFVEYIRNNECFGMNIRTNETGSFPSSILNIQDLL